MLDNDNDNTTEATEAPTAAPTRGARAAASPRAGRRAVPPKRVRVSALAKDLGIPSKQLVSLLADLGEAGKTASSTLDEELADRVRAAHEAADGAAATWPAAGRATTDEPTTDEPTTDHATTGHATTEPAAAAAAPPVVLFVAPTAEPAPTRRRRAARAPAGPPREAGEPVAEGPDITVAEDAADATAEPEDVREAAEAEAATAARRRRRRGRRGRGGGAGAAKDDAEGGEPIEADEADEAEDADAPDEAGDQTTAAADGEDADATPATRRRRRRRRSGGGGGGGEADGETGEADPPNTVVHVREAREQGKGRGGKGRGAEQSDDDDGVRGVKGSTRLEARRQRRRDGRDTSRRRPPILTESEFLARREAVDRVMAVRQHGDRTQIAVLEDNVLVEHYVTRASATSYVGNVYLGRVQNVLPSMEAAFIDIGKGRNGVLYAGEVNWDAAGLEGKSRAIEQALKSGDAVLVQVTKDPIGHKGARLTSQVSLPGRFLVYVPGGGMTGISRRLPDTERHRLKSILKKIVPEDAGVIVRTAAEGASEEDLTRDVERLQAEWAAITKKAAKTSAAPMLVHGEPDLAIRVVRDVFNEDFAKLVVQGEDAWATISDYISGVAPDLEKRVSRHTGDSDLFHDLRVDEQIMKALDRKVWLPSGGSLVIDRTEAMTVIDVNTGKFVGSGGNLEQTVTRNNLEAAEEIVRQLRLRDVGGIVVIDFIDMVLESNRDLVLRRLTECLGRDRTKHQVAEVTSLGLVQMTRKRVGEGLLEAFSHTCETCHGRGVIVQADPVDKSSANGSNGHPDDDDGDARPARGRRKRGGAKRDEPVAEVDPEVLRAQREKALAAMSAIHRAAHANGDVDTGSDDPDLDVADLDAADLATDATAAAVRAVEGVETALPDAADGHHPAASGPDGAAAAEHGEHAGDAGDGQPGEATAPRTPTVAAPATAPARPRRRRAASRPAGPPVAP